MVEFRQILPFIFIILINSVESSLFTRVKRQESKSPIFNAPSFTSFSKDQTLTVKDKDNLDKVGEVANEFLERLGLTYEGREVRRKEPLPSTLYQSDDINNIINEANQNRVDLQGLTSGQIPGLAPIPVPGYPGPQDVPTVPGVNTIPGLKNFNYVVSNW